MAGTEFRSYVRIIKADLYRYGGAAGMWGFCRTYFRQPGFRYTVWMRTASYLSVHPFLKISYWIASRTRHHLEVKYGISIPHSTQIGPGLFIGHFGGIVVNEHASIGRNCNLSHGVTIGQKNRGRFKGCPRVGDSVYIGPGAAIIGSVSVGSNVAIGANAVVVDHVGDNEVVAGNPAHCVSSKGAEGYINWTLHR
jgi:serine O-acetyltransferase